MGQCRTWRPNQEDGVALLECGLHQERIPYGVRCRDKHVPETRIFGEIHGLHHVGPFAPNVRRGLVCKVMEWYVSWQGRTGEGWQSLWEEMLIIGAHGTVNDLSAAPGPQVGLNIRGEGHTYTSL